MLFVGAVSLSRTAFLCIKFMIQIKNLQQQSYEALSLEDWKHIKRVRPLLSHIPLLGQIHVLCVAESDFASNRNV